MATSGSTTWSLQRDDVINGALRKLGVLPEGVTANASQIASGVIALNAMVKGFQTDGMPVWAIKEYTFTTVAGIGSYDIGIAKTINTPMPLKVLQAYRIEQTGAVNVPLLYIIITIMICFQSMPPAESQSIYSTSRFLHMVL